MRYKAVVSYNGARYFGWQRQKDVISLQSVIEEKLSTIFNKDIIIYASGRTDALVHARGQVFHFDAPLFPTRKLKYALNRLLPPDIVIKTLVKTSDTFHARYAAKLKRYEYIIKTAAKDPFNYEEVLLYTQDVNINLLNNIANNFIGIHNFQNFTSKPTDEENFKREITEFIFKKRGSTIKITITGTGFMRGQIRFMLGALLAINEGREQEDYIKNTLNNEVRTIIPYKVSGHALYLDKVWY